MWLPRSSLSPRSGVGSAILVAATLSFLGLGSQPPTPEWGRMLSEGRQYLREQWWIATFPGLAIMLTVLALNMLGDGLRDAPRSTIEDMRTIIYPEWLLDGTGAPARVGQALAFAEGRIEAVGAAEDMHVDDGDEVLRRPGETLLPGLINMHVHLSLASDNGPFVPYMDAHSDVALALRAAHNARISLEAGITTVRDCGARRTTVLELRDAQTSGLLQAARIVSCGWPLTITGGHMRPFGGEVDGETRWAANGPADHQCRADFIKVGSGRQPGSITDRPSFLPDELEEIVRTAHGLGRRVTMHCTATAAIANALAARVDSIEHGYFSAPGAVLAFDDAIADGLAAAAIPVTPDTASHARHGGVVARGRRSRDLAAAARGADGDDPSPSPGRRALLVGSDAGGASLALTISGASLKSWCRADSATRGDSRRTGAAAAAIGRADEFGMLRPGLSADLLLVNGEAARDVRRLADVRAVYGQGRRPGA